ncbi:hypothetical protein CLF_109724 [Clonorchis sinensis]|uniref:Uncharacterized protein n=1 Tax=Clonorchis sinensis TaxID=79923 RepID=G7YJQ4_CLOSI|nr:hypothetical protein CLF_109724 [Clonorchis sinensis]
MTARHRKGATAEQLTYTLNIHSQVPRYVTRTTRLDSTVQPISSRSVSTESREFLSSNKHVYQRNHIVNLDFIPCRGLLYRVKTWRGPKFEGCRKLGDYAYLLSSNKKGETGRGLSKRFQQPYE